MKKLLLGAEAIAQGAIDGGMSGIYAYPGTPSTEITEYVQKSKLASSKKTHSQWSRCDIYLISRKTDGSSPTQYLS